MFAYTVGAQMQLARSYWLKSTKWTTNDVSQGRAAAPQDIAQGGAVAQSAIGVRIGLERVQGFNHPAVRAIDRTL